MMPRLAASLVTLRSEVNAFAPNRSKRLDGWIGDAAHAARASRHNPNKYGVVTALDLTHDPEGGFDAHAFARKLTDFPHPNLYYVISNRESAYRKSGWRWRKYGGSHPHDRHIHLAVGIGPDSDPMPPYDNTDPWGVAELMGGEVDVNDAQDKLIKQARVSDVAQSYDNEIIKALLKGDPDKAARLETEKHAAVSGERARLGL